MEDFTVFKSMKEINFIDGETMDSKIALPGFATKVNSIFHNIFGINMNSFSSLNSDACKS